MINVYKIRYLQKIIIIIVVVESLYSVHYLSVWSENNMISTYYKRFRI